MPAYHPPLCLLLVGAVASCSSGSSLVAVSPDLPGDLDYAGLLLYGVDGAIIGATGLIPRGADGVLRTELPAVSVPLRRVAMFGFRRSDLAGIVLPEEAVHRSAPLEVARPGGAVLPAASWFATGELTGDVARIGPGGPPEASPDPLAATELTASWLPPCPRRIELGATSLDVACAPSTPATCSGRVEQVGCRLVADTSNCPLGRLEGAVDGRGRITYEPTERLGSCVDAPPSEGASVTAACSAGRFPQCRIDAYSGVFPLRFAVEDVAVLEVAPRLMAGLARLAAGFLSGIVALDDRIAVGTHDGVFQGQSCVAPAQPSRLVFFDPDSRARIGTATAPPCLLQLVRDPTSNAILGAYGGRAPRLGRFDATGRLLESVAITDPDVGSDHYPTDVVASAAGGWVAIVYSGNLENTDERAEDHLLIFDARTLAVRATAKALGTEVISVAEEGAGVALVVDDAGDRLVAIDVTNGHSLRQGFFEALRGGAKADLAMIHHSARAQSTLLSAVGVDAAVYTFTPNEHAIAGSGVYYEYFGEPVAMSPWPARSELMIVGVTEREGPRRASAALFDPGLGRFLPGSAVIGTGPVTRLVADRAGRIWAMLPWTAHVARISAAD